MGEDHRDIELTIVLHHIREGISKGGRIPKRNIKDIVPPELKNRIKAYPGNAITRNHIAPLIHVEAVVSRGEIHPGLCFRSIDLALKSFLGRISGIQATSAEEEQAKPHRN